MQGNTPTKKRRYRRGFTHTAALVETRVQKTGSARGFAQMRLLTHWEEIVGVEIASIARPIKVSYARQGIGAKLTLLARAARAPELQMQIPRIKERVNASYGYSAISDIRITQAGSAEGFSEPPTTFNHDQPPPALPDEKIAQLQADLAGIRDPHLKAPLESLGKNILLTSKGNTE